MFEDVVVLQYLAAPVDADEAGLMMLIIDRLLHVHTQVGGKRTDERRECAKGGEPRAWGTAALVPPNTQFGWG